MVGHLDDLLAGGAPQLCVRLARLDHGSETNAQATAYFGEAPSSQGCEATSARTARPTTPVTPTTRRRSGTGRPRSPSASTGARMSSARTTRLDRGVAGDQGLVSSTATTDRVSGPLRGGPRRGGCPRSWTGGRVCASACCSPRRCSCSGWSTWLALAALLVTAFWTVDTFTGQVRLRDGPWTTSSRCSPARCTRRSPSAPSASPCGDGGGPADRACRSRSSWRRSPRHGWPRILRDRGGGYAAVGELPREGLRLAVGARRQRWRCIELDHRCRARVRAAPPPS